MSCSGVNNASLAWFQSTSSEEDVVSNDRNKHGLAPYVSIHVLRRGRCVFGGIIQVQTLQTFQSTSSEEDVVSEVIGVAADTG